MNNLFKGIIGGIGNIVPGLSGSALLVIFGIYEKCIEAITEIVNFKNIQKNILYLLPITIGIVLGTIGFGKIIKLSLNKWPTQTSCAFFGFILGTIPMLFKEANKKGFEKKYLIAFYSTFFLGIIITLLKINNLIKLTNINYIEKLFLGLILAVSTIIPGISGTVLLSAMGIYDVYLTAITEVDIIFFIPVGIGFILGIIFLAILVNYLLKKYYGYTFYAIIGFVIATIPTILIGPIKFNITGIISLIILLLSFFMTYLLSNHR